MCAQRSTSGSNWFGSTVPEEEHVSKHSLRYRGVANPDLKIGAQAGCALSPEVYLGVVAATWLVI